MESELTTKDPRPFSAAIIIMSLICSRSRIMLFPDRYGRLISDCCCNSTVTSSNNNTICTRSCGENRTQCNDFYLFLCDVDP